MKRGQAPMAQLEAQHLQLEGPRGIIDRIISPGAESLREAEIAISKYTFWDIDLKPVIKEQKMQETPSIVPLTL